MKAFLDQLNKQRLRSYEADPGLLKEHFGIEETVLAGGYGYRQILELVQNGADALLEAREHGGAPVGDGRIHVQISGQRLYVANTGAPLSEQGLDALLRAHSSPKRGNQIGRFGLGFKSLLKLDGSIDVLTRTGGAIRFDPARCREELRKRFNVAEAPAMRLAWPLSVEERTADPLCAELSWAETIVRVDVASGSLLEHLREEIRSFPAEFLLFFPIATVLTLDDGANKRRGVRLSIDGSEHILHDGDAVSRWRVATREVSIVDARAITDATHIHARESVPIAWAMPLEGRREEAGRFWAFFPTHTPTYLPGILNAPWKLNSDRQAIIGGEWNTVLMKEGAMLIADTLPSLATVDDPALHLDAFPRQMERKDEDAAPLIDELWKRLEISEIIPDGTGTLRRAHDLWRYPNDTQALAAAWQALACDEALRQLPHASSLQNQRASRLNALAKRIEAPTSREPPPSLRRRNTKSWFGLVASTDCGKALGVLRLAKDFSAEVKGYEWQKTCPTLEIIPSQSGELVTAAAAVLAPEGVFVPGRASVAIALQSDSEARGILKDVLCVKEPDNQVWTSILAEALRVRSWTAEAVDAVWNTFWSRLRRAPAEVRRSFLEANKDQIRLRRRDGRWAKADGALFPGGLVSKDEPAPNSNVLVDPDAHGNDLASLEILGVATTPAGDIGPVEFREVSVELLPWLDACRSQYKKTQSNRADRGYLYPISLSMPRSYGLLPELTGQPRARFTSQLLARLSEPKYVARIRFGHITNNDYAKIEVLNPLPWFVLSQGELQFGPSATAPLRAIIARQHETVLQRLPDWDNIQSALGMLSGASPDVSANSDDIRALWIAATAALVTHQAIETDALADLWSAAGKDGVIPSDLPGSAGRIPLVGVFVTTSHDLARRARSPRRVVVTLDPATLSLWLGAGAQDLAQLVSVSWDDVAGLPERLTDVVPELMDVLREDVRDRDLARCQRVTGLRLKIGDSLQGVPCLMSEGTLYLDMEQLAKLSRADRLRHLLAEVAASGWLVDISPEVALRRLDDAQVDERRSHVAQGATLAERLLRAVGGRIEPLLDTFGPDLRGMDFVRNCSSENLAELVIAQLGPATLSTLRDTLEVEGLNPPRRWNTAEALGFAVQIGFPTEFASSAEARREPEEFISGPIELPPLHGFQEEVFVGLSALLATGTKRRRAVVSLPTGGGKTRVTVEAAVRLVLEPEGTRRVVLWIAQTDELCEQAVQAFRQVWVNLGAQRTDLRIVRLWGGNPNPAGQEPDKPVVVVASIQTLNKRVGTAHLTWLQQPGLVVVDECHHAITKSYSELLRWLDAEAPRPGSPEKDEPPVVGLSATPFRTDDDESKRLARRFDNRWLPADQEQLYSRLLAQRVLAQPSYESMESGSVLTDDELNHLGHMEAWEGLDFEKLLEKINQRLAGDVRRNERLVECIESSDERSILFFTNSVAHAEEMAARLNLAGIGAAAISGETATSARRYFLDRFQRGQIRVLCNHSVLTTGFDAPRTEMVLIARQVFSPVRYMQMVGRGLRGEKNGGTSSCRIITVLDNLGRFQERHPYHYCRQHYS